MLYSGLRHNFICSKFFHISEKKNRLCCNNPSFFWRPAHPNITRAKIRYVLGRWQRCIKLIFPGFLSRKFDILHFASTGDRMMWDPESNWNRRYPQQGKFTVLRDKGLRSSLEGNVTWWGIRNREEDPWRENVRCWGSRNREVPRKKNVV